jgi:hypothetical protein
MEIVYLLLALAVIAGVCYALIWWIQGGPLPPLAKWLAVGAVVVLGVVLALGAADETIGLGWHYSGELDE